MSPYFFRLCLLSLAVLFALQSVVSVFFWLAVPKLIRIGGERWSPASKATALLVIRWSAPIVAWLGVLAVCVPSYLRLEPASGGEEEVGGLCVAMAIGAVLLYAVPAVRVLLQVAVSGLRVRQLLRRSSRRSGDVYVVDRPSPRMALVGVFRPSVVVSTEVIDSLPSDQFEVALRHELAHRRAHDNWKRLLFDLAPLSPGHTALRTARNRSVEWAADDWATAGDPGRAVALAAALVHVARLGGCGCDPHLQSALVSDAEELRLRVDRLLHLDQAQVTSTFGPVWTAPLAAALAFFCALATNPTAQAAVHQLLEALID